MGKGRGEEGEGRGEEGGRGGERRGEGEGRGGGKGRGEEGERRGEEGEGGRILEIFVNFMHWRLVNRSHHGIYVYVLIPIFPG